MIVFRAIQCSFLIVCICNSTDAHKKHLINGHRATIFEHLNRINEEPALSKSYIGKLEIYRITKDRDYINIYQLGDLDNFFLTPIQDYSRYKIAFKAYKDKLLAGEFTLILRKSSHFPGTERSVFITTDTIDTIIMQSYVNEFLKTH